MIRTKLLPAVVAGLVLYAAAGQAQALSGARVRADDGDLWHLRDNPALLSFSPRPFELGVAYSSVDASGAAVPFDFQSGTWGFSLVTPLVNYLYAAQDGVETNRVGTALPFQGMGRAFSLGYAYSWGSGVAGGGLSSFGVIVRPVDFASLGATLDLNGADAPLFGFGLALRPLVFAPRVQSLLTFTADANLQGGVFTMETIGARIFLFNSLSLRGWYDFRSSAVGLELSLALGPAGEHASLASVAQPDRWTAGQSIGVPPPGGEPVIPGAGVLVFKGIDSIGGTSSLGGPARLFGTKRSLPFRELVDTVDRAAADGRIAAIVFEDLPSVGGRARAQELAQALAKARRAGKKVYFFASDYADSAQFQILGAEADWLSASPGGTVNLRGLAVRGLYLKEFLDRLGVRVANIATGKTKDAGNFLSENSMPDEDRAMVERYLGDLQAQALDAFARGRGDRLKGTPADVLAAGPYLTAHKALDSGVIDALQYRDDFEAMVRKDTPGAAFVSSYPKPRERSWGPSLFTRRVAVVHLSGNVVSGQGAVGLSIGKTTVDLLKKLREDPAVAAVLLRVESPGGSAVTSDEIADQVRRTVEAGKPVVVSMGNVAASGGYYISANASRIFAEPATITGSIGVVSVAFNFADTLAKLGIHTDGVRLSESGGTLDPLSPFRERDLALVREQVQSLYGRFTATVARGRKMEPAAVEALGNGRVWTGREAVGNGLVDALGGLSDAEKYLADRLGGLVRFDDYYPGPVSLFDRLFGPGVSELAAAVAGDTRPDALKAIDAALGPYARGVLGLLEMGGGPLFYCPYEPAGE